LQTFRALFCFLFGFLTTYRDKNRKFVLSYEYGSE